MHQSSLLFNDEQQPHKTKPPKTAAQIDTPLYDRLRPQKLCDIVGQDHIVGENGILSKMVAQQKMLSLILWGPPGCGKTTIARIVAYNLGYHFEIISALKIGVAELKTLFAKAKEYQKLGTKTLIFIDEIHRFNRAQQDVFLPYIEDGTIILMGATTENPSFELNAALLSRCKVLELHRLTHEALRTLIERAEAYLGKKLPIEENVYDRICAIADGDGRYLVSMCEELLLYNQNELITAETLSEYLNRRATIYDKGQDSHYNLISALHKSLRGSDVDAALYWCMRMLEGGEDPMYILRRLVRFAVEDIGLSDPEAVKQALAAKDTYHFLGSPEGELAIAQAVIYLATAPKSNACYTAFKSAKRAAKETGSLMPPKHILNAPTQMMKSMGYGDGYQYDHDTQHGFSGQNYFPDTMDRQTYYSPSRYGFEKDIQKRLEYWNKLRRDD
ncbi:MAG: replication-associated recombination protein A [Rickettsiales bacterium]|nr:replication-associated recombination protein A [Rickettsiales bacterium]